MTKAEKTSTWYDEAFKEREEYQKAPKKSCYFPLWKKMVRMIAKDDRVADFGCGPGQFAWLAFRKKRNYVLGVDFSKQAIEMAKALNPEHKEVFFVANLNDPGVFQMADYTVAVLCEVLEHVEHDLGVLSNLKPGTKVIASLPLFDASSHVRHFKDEKDVRDRYAELIDVETTRTIKVRGLGVVLFHGTRKLPRMPQVTEARRHCVKVCMFVKNPINRDPRVKHEAESLVEAGHTVTVIGTTAPELPAREVWRGVTFLRLPQQSGVFLSKLAKWIRWRERATKLLRGIKEGGSSSKAGGGTSEQPATASPRSAPAPTSVVPRGLRRSWLICRGCIEELIFSRPWILAGIALKADVYHAHDLNTLRPAYVCARFRRAKLVYDSHELWVEWCQNQLGEPPDLVRQLAATEAQLAPAADLVITVSDGIAEELRRTYEIRRPLVIRNCAPLTPLAPSDRLRQLIGGDRRRPILLYQGGLSRGRGLLEIVATAGLVPEADFVFLGVVTDSDLARDIDRAISTAKNRNVYLLPPVPYDILLNATCSADLGFVLTQPTCLSYELSESNKVFEYMMAGIPIVASQIESHRRIEKETGAVVLVDADDPRDIARGVNELLKDPARMKRMGALGREWAEQKYNASHEMKKLRAAYDELGKVKRANCSAVRRRKT